MLQSAFFIVMNRYFKLLLFIFLCFFQATCFATSFCHNDERTLFDDLMIVEYWNRCLNDRLPVTYNNLLQGGYINMPSARMKKEGVVAAGFSYVPPYRNYNMAFQLTDRFEVSANYRIFIGVQDPILSHYGFGDLSDKGANLKFALFLPEESNYELPGIAFGFEDFIGTRNFRSNYIVFTQVFLKQNLELSFGYGSERIRGCFGGAAWFPFRNTVFPYLQPLCLTAEYDATPYKDPTVEKHPHGRVKKTSFNFGLKYRLWDLFEFDVSYVRGHRVSCAISADYNLGHTQGFIPKIEDPLPYRAPVNWEPIGVLRPEKALVQDLVFAFNEQGFDLMECQLGYNNCYEKELRLSVINSTYLFERQVRCRLNHLLAYLIPEDIDKVIVTIISEAMPVQEYRFIMSSVREFAAQGISSFELDILTPLHEVSYPKVGCSTPIYRQSYDFWEYYFAPRTYFLFGSAKGKFKYALGLDVGVDGYWGGVYYSFLFGYNALENLYNIADSDRLNPSQLINVRTDSIRYLQRQKLCMDEGYLQKNWNMGRGWFSKLSVGYFEFEYGGVAGQLLYYPIWSRLALGVEGAVLKKRTYTGLGFTGKIRKLHHFTPSYHKFIGSQFFFNAYYDWDLAQLDFRLKAGKFLANDYGARFEITRYFDSGLRVSIWYTLTNGNDHINGHSYHDKGVAISVPLEFFYMHSSRKRWDYAIAAWLRDVGAFSATGMDLYNIIHNERY